MLIFLLLCWNPNGGGSSHGGGQHAAAGDCQPGGAASPDAGAQSLQAWDAFLAQQCPAGSLTPAPAGAPPPASPSLAVLFAEVGRQV